ncbi:MAG: hypothetical protein DI570_09800 [Phenylobacterium zucineum]|nr:MAG: hypothetical protein DI570_09800 [Phenylobacterium zucineum]
MADIFISYRMQDSTILADELSRLLRKVGWSVWFAPHLDVGDELEAISPELKAARCVIGLWSRTADKSQHVLAEFDEAKAARKLLAVVTDAAELPEAYRSGIAGNLSRFGMMTYGPDLPQLLRGVVRLAGLPPGFRDAEHLIEAAVDEEFGFYALGNITVPAKYLFSSPDEPFGPADVIIHDSDEAHEARPNYPPLLREIYPALLDNVFTRYAINRSDYSDNRLPRLDRWRQAPETVDDRRGPLHLHLSRTTYFQIWATHNGVDVPLRELGLAEGTTLRRTFCIPPYEDFSESILANNPSVEVVVVSDNPRQSPPMQMIIRRRRLTVAGYRGWFQASASGHLGLGHLAADGTPSPFAAAIAEARQEVSSSLDLTPDDFRLLGLTLKEQDLNPAFFGFIRTPRLAAELVHDHCRDNYEGKKSAIPFDPDTVLGHISANRWYPLSAMAIMATLFALHAPEAVQDAARRVPRKRVQDFYFEHNRPADQAAG